MNSIESLQWSTSDIDLNKYTHVNTTTLSLPPSRDCRFKTENFLRDQHQHQHQHQHQYGWHFSHKSGQNVLDSELNNKTTITFWDDSKKLFILRINLKRILFRTQTESKASVSNNLLFSMYVSFMKKRKREIDVFSYIIVEGNRVKTLV
jgi:hypothetical protein